MHRALCIVALAMLVTGVPVAVHANGTPTNPQPGQQAPQDKADLNAGVTAYKHEDYAKAYTKLSPLASRGNAKAQYYLGRMYEHGEGRAADSEKAIKWYSAGAEGGYARAQYKVAAGYLYGYGSIKKDEAKAREWLLKSAEGGYRRAQRILAAAYERGEIGFPVDPEKAKYWEKKAKR